MNETGLVQIYCGDGKGKTTAAIGAAVAGCRTGIPGYWWPGCLRRMIRGRSMA